MENRGLVFIAFIELALNSNWEELSRFAWGDYLDTKTMGNYLGEGWMLFRAGRDAQVEVIEPEATRRWLAFREKAILAVSNRMIRYDDKDFDHELTVDEKKQSPNIDSTTRRKVTD